MPRYDVECETCGIGEVWRPIIEEELPWRCSTCHGPAVRLWSAPAAAKVPRDSPILHQEYFHSDEVQAKLRSGELEVPSKGSDISQRR